MIDLKDLKIDLTGFEEMDSCMNCVECNHEILWKDIIGWGDYPKGGYRNSMKPNRLIGIGVECPVCFTKQVFHPGNFDIEIYFEHLDKE